MLTANQEVSDEGRESKEQPRIQRSPERDTPFGIPRTGSQPQSNENVTQSDDQLDDLIRMSVLRAALEFERKPFHKRFLDRILIRFAPR